MSIAQDAAPWSSEKLSKEIVLWPAGAPGSEGKTGEELFTKGVPNQSSDHISNIHRPSITPFLPAKEKATGVAVVICPGGAHKYLAIFHEGYSVAQWLAEHGVAAFVLKYRLQNDEAGGSTYKADVEALADAQRALRTVRSRAAAWGIDPDKVGILGFSAGGEVAALAGTRFDKGQPQSDDPIDRVSSRPNFMALVYPEMKPETLPVPAEAPPAFLLHADNDKRSPETRSVPFYLALKKAGISAEMHVYAAGGHGFGMRDIPQPVHQWPTVFLDWLVDRGFVKR